MKREYKESRSVFFSSVAYENLKKEFAGKLEEAKREMAKENEKEFDAWKKEEKEKLEMKKSHLRTSHTSRIDEKERLLEKKVSFFCVFFQMNNFAIP